MKWEGRDTWVMRLHDDGALDEGTKELWPSWKLDAHFEDAESTQSLVDLLNKMEKYKTALTNIAGMPEANGEFWDVCEAGELAVDLAKEALK